MIPGGYNPKNHNGKIWWNENNPEMRAIWGTQESYDEHIRQGGSWGSYFELCRSRINEQENDYCTNFASEKEINEQGKSR